MNTVYASSEPIESEAVETQEDGIAASLGLNGQLFAFQLLNFAIVAVIIWFLILKPLTKKLEERKNLIDESLDKAKQIDANLQMAEAKFQERIDEAKAESSKIVEKAFGEGEKLIVEMKKRAQKEIEIVVDQARRNIKIEKEEMAASLKQETVNLIITALEKILSEKVDSKKDKELIEETLASFRTQKG